VNFAAKHGNAAELRSLLANGANAISEGVLQGAASKGHVECVAAQLAAGARLDTADASGSTALMWAARKGHLPCVKALLTAGASIVAADHNGMTALMLAAQDGHVPCIEALLAAGASGNALNEQSGMSALHYAVANDHLAAVRCLEAAGADLTARDSHGRTPRALAQALGKHGFEIALQQLEQARRNKKGVWGSRLHVLWRSLLTDRCSGQH
jgi:ankyrin repeat protein